MQPERPLENINPTDWIGKLKSEKNPQTLLEAVMALARVGDPGQQDLAVSELSKMNWDQLTKSQQLHLLRDYALILIRMGEPNPTTQAALQKLASHFPAGDPELDRELARVLAAANVPQVVAGTIELLEVAPTQEEQIHYAMGLAQCLKQDGIAICGKGISIGSSRRPACRVVTPLLRT